MSTASQAHIPNYSGNVKLLSAAADPSTVHGSHAGTADISFPTWQGSAATEPTLQGAENKAGAATAKGSPSVNLQQGAAASPAAGDASFDGWANKAPASGTKSGRSLAQAAAGAGYASGQSVASLGGWANQGAADSINQGAAGELRMPCWQRACLCMQSPQAQLHHSQTSCAQTSAAVARCVVWAQHACSGLN